MGVFLFIHGFGSDSRCNKCRQLLERVGKERVIIPTVEYHDLPGALDQLERIVQTQQITSVYGASMGAFLAQYLAKRYGIDAVLINPVIEPLKLIGYAQGTHFTKQSLQLAQELTEYNRTHPFTRASAVLLGIDDEKLDIGELLDYFQKSACKVYDDDHALINGFGDYLDREVAD